jgi:methionyl-tRNA formyltransferase
VLAEARIDIAPEDTIAVLHQKANRLFPQLVLSVLEAFDRGSFAGRDQDHSLAAYWHQRNDDDGLLNCACMTADEALRQIRALTRPYPGAFATYHGNRVRIFGASMPALAVRGAPGRFCWLMGIGPYLVFRDRALLLTDYAVDGKPQMQLTHGSRID